MGEFDHIVAAMQASPVTSAFMEMVELNDFSRLDKSTAKRHHFVPQLLLRGFSHPHQGKPHVFQMDTGSRRAPTRVGIRSAAVRAGLYAAPGDDGKPSNRNEGYLALIESFAGPAVRHLLDAPETLSAGERMTIAFFVALQTMRTPAAAEQVTTLANAAFQAWASEFYSDRRAFAERHREFFGEDKTDEELEQFRQETIAQIRDGRLRLSGQPAALSTGLVHAIENVPMLFSFEWILLRAAGGGLITSDRGYAIHDPSLRFPWEFQALYSSDSSETTIPLSDEACLAMRPSLSCGLAVQEASAHDVETINLRTHGWADKYVFGKRQDTLVAVRQAVKRRPVDVIRPKPFTQLVLLEPDPDDNSLAEAHLHQGWPPQVRKDGELRDDIVIPCDEPHPELRKLADDLTERRARKRAGVSPDEPFEGRIVHRPIHPLDTSG